MTNETTINEIEINGVKYVKKGTESIRAESLDGMEYCIVRGDRSGVFAGYIEKLEGREVYLRNARRIWYWDGAASISQLAEDGITKPDNCKFPKQVKLIKILDAIEILSATQKAKNSIAAVKIWEES